MTAPEMPDEPTGTVHCGACGTSFELEGLAIYPLSNGLCEACIREARKRPWRVLAENQELREERDRLREDRARFQAALGKVPPEQLARIMETVAAEEAEPDFEGWSDA